MPELHQITLETIDEAAAFVAALTRQLAAPGVDVHSASTEVAVAVRGTGAEVYLSPHALAASEARSLRLRRRGWWAGCPTIAWRS